MTNFHFTKIDNKHCIMLYEHSTHPILAKYTVDNKFVPIPQSEPTILFRGRDKLALPMLEHYRSLCVADGCTDFQLASMDDMIAKFRAFAEQSGTMKQPGCTEGL